MSDLGVAFRGVGCWGTLGFWGLTTPVYVETNVLQSHCQGSDPQVSDINQVSPEGKQVFVSP